MAPRKVRLVANLIKGMPVVRAKSQLTFLVKKPAPFILKLLNSAVANAKHNFQLTENNLKVEKIVVEAGSTLKRWLPRAMGRASALHKRTCGVTLWLAEINPTAQAKNKTNKLESDKKEEASLKGSQIDAENDKVGKSDKKASAGRTRVASVENKKRNFAQPPAGGLKKVFRRKSI